MSKVNEIYSEVETFRGLLMALMVNYPDLTPRLEPAIAKVDSVLKNPNDQTVHFLVEDMVELQEYFNDIISMLNKESDKSMISSINKTLELMGLLLGPEERVSLQ